MLSDESSFIIFLESGRVNVDGTGLNAEYLHDLGQLVPLERRFTANQYKDSKHAEHMFK